MIGRLCRSLVLVACFACQVVHAQYSIEAAPATPEAFVHFDAWVTLHSLGAEARPEVEIVGNTINLYLNGGCPFATPCGVPGNRFRFSIPGVPPGSYELVFFRFTKASPGPVAATARITVATGTNYQGLWWRAPAGSESGWGLQIAHQANRLFATWFTYDASGQPTWLVMPDALWTGPGAYEGTVYRATSASGGAGLRLVPSTGVMPAGHAVLSFMDADNGTFLYEGQGATLRLPITRQVFAPARSTCTTGGTSFADRNFQDLYWSAPAGSEPGWGVQVEQQGAVLFVTLYGYDAAGRPAWLVASDVRAEAGNPTRYRGTLYRTTGRNQSESPWRPQEVTVTAAGQMSLAFFDGYQGELTLALDETPGIVTRKTFTRQQFGAAETVCR